MHRDDGLFRTDGPGRSATLAGGGGRGATSPRDRALAALREAIAQAVEDGDDTAVVELTAALRGPTAGARKAQTA
jgi:hypothetical protein